MNFITSSFTEYDTALSELLGDAGFSPDQTSEFLPEAAAGMLEAFQNKDIEMIISAFGSNDPGQLLGHIDINTVARKAGLDPEQAAAGVKAITPLLTQVFKHNSDGMVGAAMSIAWESKRDSRSFVKRLFG